MGRDGSPKRSPRKRSRLASRKGEQAPRPPFTAPDPWEQYYSNNPPLQRSGWIGAFLAVRRRKRYARSIDMVQSSLPLNANLLGRSLESACQRND